MAVEAPAAGQLTDFSAAFFSQNDTALGTAEPEDELGRSMVAADFDGDGFVDLAVGVPGETVDGWTNSGAVHVLYGYAGGVSLTRNQIFHQDSTGVGSTAQHDERFGAALAAGDFDDDGRMDLAIGGPEQDVDGDPNAGAVWVLWGAASGLTASGSLFITQDNVFHPLDETSDIDDRCGESLAATRRPGVDLLWVGCPGEDLYVGSGDHGLIFSISLDDRTTTFPNEVSQDIGSVDGDAENDDEFGAALAAGDFNGDGRDDLAIGVPLEDVNGFTNCGYVNVIYGTAAWMDVADVDGWSPDSSGVQGACDAGDHFGSALAAGDFDGDGYDDLAIGIEQDEVGGVDDVGAVTVLYGSSGRLTATDQIWSQDSADVQGGAEGGDGFGSALAAGDFDGNGLADLAVGSPTEGVDDGVADRAGAGTVNVLYGFDTSGLNAAGDQIFNQFEPELMPDIAENGDHFATALAAGDFDGNGYADLAIGVPDENVVSGQINEGMVIVLYGTNPANGAFGTLDFVEEVITVPESVGTVTIEVVRTGGAPVFADADVVSGAGGALQGVDYTGLPGHVVWDEGELGIQTVTLTIVDDTTDEPNEPEILSLVQLSRGTAEAGGSATVYLWINDDDPTGQLFKDGFESAGTSKWSDTAP